jgi:hypothetical protein
MSVYKENNAMKKSPSNTSFEILLNGTKSNIKLEMHSLDFYTGNRKNTTEKNLLVVKKFQSNF